MVRVCPQLQTNGACSDSSCIFNHDVRICEDCNVLCISAASYNAHLAGKKHRSKVLGLSTLFRCPLCHIQVYGPTSWNQHISGASHQSKAARQGVPAEVEPLGAADLHDRTYCGVCDRYIPGNKWPSHTKGKAHRNKERFTAFKTALEEAHKNKHGVTVSEDLDFGIVNIADAQKSMNIQFNIETTVPASRIRIVDAKFSSSNMVNTSPPFSVAIQRSTLSFRRPVTGEVKFREAHNGRYEDRLEFIFEDERLSQRFIIVRTIHAIIGNKEDHELLKPVAPYVPRKRVARELETEIIEGVLPPTLKAVPYIVKLGHSEIPKNLSLSLSTGSGSLSDVIGRVRRIFLPESWDSSTYGRHFKTLLWIEEYRMEFDLEMYDIHNATMTNHGKYYYLAVPGLAEKRPSVLIGDRILVQRHGSPPGQWYEGGVHVVRKEEVGLRFHTSFRGWSKTQLYKVRFKLNRYPLRRQHQALDTAFVQDRLLLPPSAHINVSNPDVSGLRLRCYNKLVATNPYQLQAVSSIVQLKAGSVPFIIFGPPGTGKTVTIVEAIRQLLIHNPSAHILACAPSNSAADLIVSRLTDLGSDMLFRFYAASCNKDHISDELSSFTALNADRHFSVPSMSRMRRFRVVVTTCVSASFAYGIGMPRGHFSHIFFDEAGQATEPEVMIAIKTMADNSTNVILSGDPKQLGPIIRSNIARELGLEMSYLQRLMGTDMYDPEQQYSSTVVKLIKNFRSHEAILEFPNERFYNSELQQCGDPNVINSMIGSPQLVSKAFPIVFHAISGKDDREASSPSFFNIDEATQVKMYVEALRADRRFRCTDKDIGVIAPYHAQCLKIRAVLKPIAEDVKVGSVEEFQGQERKVVLISTVRSSRKFVQYDLKHTLGFIANPRRFNVAVTRAKALLIVVGDPSILSLDPLWRSFLNYIHVNGGWRGKPIGWDPRAPVTENGGYYQESHDASLVDMNDFTRRMESLTLNGVRIEDDKDTEEDAEDANVDRPWREVE